MNNDSSVKRSVMNLWKLWFSTLRQHTIKVLHLSPFTEKFSTHYEKRTVATWANDSHICPNT